MISNNYINDLSVNLPLNEKIVPHEKDSLWHRFKASIEHFKGLILALISAIFVSMSTTLNKKAEFFSANEQAVGNLIISILILLWILI